MKKTVYSLLLISSTISSQAFAAGSVAGTDNYSSWYIGVDLLGSIARDSNVNDASSSKISYKKSAALSGLKVGYRPQALYNETGDARFEVELLGRTAIIDKITSGGSSTNSESDLQIGALMANGYYDFHTNSSFTPYIGAGIGVGGMGFSKLPVLGITDKASKDPVLAGQLMAGISYTPQMMPSTSWSLGYNLFMSDKPEFKTATGKVRLDNPMVSSVQLGFKYHF